MKIKNVLNIILFCGVIFVCIFFSVTFGDNCDAIEHQMQEKLNEYNHCYENCVSNAGQCNQDCEINCGDVVCGSLRAEYENLQNQYDSCSQANYQSTGVDGPTIFGSWSNGGNLLNVDVRFNPHAPNMQGLNNEIYCDAISVNGGSASISSNSNSTCYISISDVTSDTVTVNVPSNVCMLGSYGNSAGSQTFNRPGGDPEGEGEGGEEGDEGEGDEGNNGEGGEGSNGEGDEGNNGEGDEGSNESCDCTVLPLSEDCYMECNSQGNNGGGNNTCHHLLQSGGTCELGYREGTASDGSACCVLVCESGSLSGDANGDYICESCIPGETIPNESHTRCICDPNFKCCGVQLNNVIPFIGDCIEMNAESNRDNTTNVNSVTAFPILMQGLMKILMSVIMIFSFLMIIVAGLMIVSGAFGGNGFATGKKIIKNVIISLILLGCSGLILSLINPSFFGG